MKYTKVVLLWLCLSAGCIAAAVVATRYVAGMVSRVPGAEQVAYRASTKGGELPELWQVPPFDFESQQGTRVRASDLTGKVWVADFIFTTCTTVCPLISGQMVLLQKQLADPDVRFVSFSVDPEHDTPNALESYRQRFARGENRWLLLRPSPSEVMTFAEGMRVAVEPSSDPSNPILHSSLFFLVDARGMVRGAYSSTDDVAMQELLRDASRLLGHRTPERPKAQASGPQLFAKLGCAGCHSNPKLAPRLAGLVGKNVEFDDGSASLADLAYLRESLLAPGKRMVAGYLKLMPSYANFLTDAELDALTEYLASPDFMDPALLTDESASEAAPDAKQVSSSNDEPRGMAASNEQPATLETDPVCKMQVRVTSETPAASFGGHAYHFCSQSCREKFLAHAAQYVTDDSVPRR